MLAQIGVITAFLALLSVLAAGEGQTKGPRSAHVRLLDQSQHVMQSDVSLDRLHVVRNEDELSYTMNEIEKLENENEIEGSTKMRALAAVISEQSYGEGMSYLYGNFSASLVIPSGTTASFGEIAFGESCKTVVTSEPFSGTACSIIVQHNATLILPDTFVLETGCIRVLGGALFGAQNLTMRHGARLQLRVDSVWVSLSLRFRCRVYFSLLLASYIMWSAALDSSGVLLPYSIVSLAQHITTN